MKFFLLVMLIVLSGCFTKPDALPGMQKFSKSQGMLLRLRDSLLSHYSSAGSEIEKRNILEDYHQKLLAYLINNPMDSIRVTIDEITTDGLTITTRSHFDKIAFKYGLKFNTDRSPRIDSIYRFMKSLKEGTDTLVNFSFTGACQVNSPDSARLPTFIIYAFPIPLQYNRR
ncbi:MAG TPA: hypothetical protein VK588_13765 [Chitinophagaceae bacterium]|nr:hypothetical protein [Chitinophagaceae bacterium]